MTAKPLPVEYQAALEGAAWYEIPQPGCLSIRGRDRASYLQRQTTHDVRLLGENRGLPTILTSPNGRILDVLYLVPGPEDSIIALTLPGKGSVTSAYFNQRIFFMDQVTVEDQSAAYAQIDLIGPCRADILSLLGFSQSPEADEILTVAWEGQPVHLLSSSAPLWAGWRLLIPAMVVPMIKSILEETGTPRLTDEIYHLLHVESGTPQVDSELTEDFTPLETGLQAAVSDSKGCYTGQEVLARQITYDKVTQKLCGLHLSELPLADHTIWHAGKQVGKVTSTGISPRFGPIGLGMIKRPHFEPGTQVLVGAQPDQAQAADVCSVPFQL